MIKPFDDRVVVLPDSGETTTPGGIVIPDTAEKPAQGTVVAVGPGRRFEDGKRVPLDVSVGQRVLYSKYGGTEIEVDGTRYLILKWADVLASVEGESDELVALIKDHLRNKLNHRPLPDAGAGMAM